MDVQIVARFEKGYIADPYWPEREKLINIDKESGLNRVRSQDRREKALRDYLASKGLAMEDYAALAAQAGRPFHTRDGTAEIVIPSQHVLGCLVQAASTCTASIRIARPEQLRTILWSTPWRTGKALADAQTWSRFVVVKSGTGKALSNQRALRENEYIENFDATGQLHFAGDAAQLPRLREFLAWAGREIGVGASRKLGWGRWELAEFEAVV